LKRRSLTGRTGVAAGTIKSQGQVLPLDVKAQGLDTVQGVVTQRGLRSRARADPSFRNFPGNYDRRRKRMYLMSGVPEGVVVATASWAMGL